MSSTQHARNVGAVPTVLQLTNGFIEGGTERQVVQLTGLLRQSGRYRVNLACLDGRGPLRIEAERLQAGAIAEFPLTSFHDANTARQLARLVRYLRDRRIALVHAHDFYTNVIGMAAARLAGVPAAVASRRDILGFRTRAQALVERWAFGAADAVLVNAEAVRRFLVAEGVPPAKLVTVHNGLDMQRVEPRRGMTREARTVSLNLPASRRFVTIVANMESDIKDHGTFLRAARHVRSAVPDAAFVLAGEGRLMACLRARADALDLAEDVFFTGRCDRVADLLAVSDVCVLSSRSEGLSNSMLEYMAAARPVVATDVGGAREAILDGETGFLVEPGDDAAMGTRITHLLRHPARARVMGERGRDVVRERFSCQAQVQRLERLYDRLLCRSQAGRG